MIAKQAVLLNEASPQPLKIIFFFKSLYAVAGEPGTSQVLFLEGSL